MFNFEDNIGLLYSKQLPQKKKKHLSVKEFFTSDLLGMELWDKMFNFEDNIRLLLLKMITSKYNPCL